MDSISEDLARLSDKAWVIDAIDAFATQRSCHVLLEALGEITELCSSFMVKRVIRIGLQKEEN